MRSSRQCKRLQGSNLRLSTVGWHLARDTFENSGMPRLPPSPAILCLRDTTSWSPHVLLDIQPVAPVSIEKFDHRECDIIAADCCSIAISLIMHTLIPRLISKKKSVSCPKMSLRTDRRRRRRRRCRGRPAKKITPRFFGPYESAKSKRMGSGRKKYPSRHTDTHA